MNITLPFIILSMQSWSASQVEFSDLFDIGDLLPWSTERLIHDECTFVQQTEWGFLSFAPFSSCLFSRYSFLSDLLATTHPTFLPLFTFSPRSLFNQSRLFHFMTWLFAPLLLCESVSCAHSRSLPSFSLCPYINTGCDLNIHVYNVFLQLH